MLVEMIKWNGDKQTSQKEKVNYVMRKNEKIELCDVNK
jgi:hypothetical protein